MTVHLPHPRHRSAMARQSVSPPSAKEAARATRHLSPARRFGG